MRSQHAATALAFLATALAAQQPDDFVWHGDLAAARRLAHEQHKPLFVLFRCER